MTAVHPEPTGGMEETKYVDGAGGIWANESSDIESIISDELDKPAAPVVTNQPRPTTSNEAPPTTSNHQDPPPNNTTTTTTTTEQPPPAYSPSQGLQYRPGAAVPLQPMQRGQAGVPQQAVVTQPVVFDAAGTLLVQQVTNAHKSHKRLAGVLYENAQSIHQTTTQQYRAHHDNMTYEQILASQLFEGEQLLLGGQYIYYTSVVFLDEHAALFSEKPPMTRGRAFLTTKRMLLLSAEEASATTLSKPDATKRKSDVYQVSVSWGDSMYLQSIPMEGFRSVDLRVAIGVTSSGNVRGEKPPCSQFWGCICCCFKPCCSCCEIECCMKQWSRDCPISQSLNERHVTIGTLMPPWGRRMMVRIHFDPSMRLLFINDFLVEMQRHAPNLNKLDLAPVQFLPCQSVPRQ